MDNLLTVALEAHHAEFNHHRRYEITVGRDLFDAWTVSVRYGRIGQGGQMQRFAGMRADELKSVIRDRLRRRLSAPKRIGCSYRLMSLSTAEGIDATAWLPAEVLAAYPTAVAQSQRESTRIDSPLGWACIVYSTGKFRNEAPLTDGRMNAKKCRHAFHSTKGEELAHSTVVAIDSDQRCAVQFCSDQYQFQTRP